jgi:predicted hydrolase (HD superfamily)
MNRDAARALLCEMKQKAFAAAVNRDDIVRGAEDLGVDLNEHIQFVIDAMAGIADQLGLAPVSPASEPG